ncbi:hypothetical protein H5410_039379 [Solanum commersonii]|uniref:Uncharacterized protein n=1 Tax=Solanum commersonii TaxID=4109 RepID=A0A9J5YBQ7_SOLCO|nr:hypothetical protein H5410_039379 [Solanum commersonii]
MEPVGPHGQNSSFSRSNEPGTDLSYGASWPSRPKRLIFKVKQASKQTLAIEPVGPHGQNSPFSRFNKPRSSYGVSWPSQPKRPIFKVKRASEQNSNFIFAETFHGRPLDLSYGASWRSRLKRPIFKVKRASEQPKNFINVVNTLSMEPVGPHGQNDPFSRSNDPRDVLSDLSYGASWPSQPKGPIFKVKRASKQTSVKTLVIEPIGPHSQNGPFSRLNKTRSR